MDIAIGGLKQGSCRVGCRSVVSNVDQGYFRLRCQSAASHVDQERRRVGCESRRSKCRLQMMGCRRCVEDVVMFIKVRGQYQTCASG